MKTIKYITILLAVVLINSCAKESIEITPESEEGRIFNLHLVAPVAKQVATRSDIIQGSLENVYILVFDNNGGFLSRSEAVRSGFDPNTFQVELLNTPADQPQDKKKRIVHIIANYDWSNFFDLRNLGKNENDIIMNLSVTDGDYVYWQRLELPDGIKQGAFDSPIELICNVAQVSVLNNSMTLTDVQYALGDYFPNGTVAPFNILSLEFDENNITQSSEGTNQTTSEDDFIVAGSGDTPTNAIICYERTNSIAIHPTYVVVKGVYSGDAQPSYYKVDIVRKGEPVLLDIQRNYHYILNITSVGSRGSNTLEEALTEPASNNLTYSIVLARYTSIAEGNSALHVETTERTFVRAGQEFRIGFSFYPVIGGKPDNSQVQVELEHEDDTKPVVASYEIKTDSLNNSYISGITADALPKYGFYTGKFILTVKRGDVVLSRTIRIRLRSPFVFENPTITPSPIPFEPNKSVVLHFSISDDIHESNYPMSVFISTTLLSPDLDYADAEDLTLDYQIQGRYRYKYVVWKPGDYTIHFKTIFDKEPNEVMEKLLLESDLFTTEALPQGS